MFSKILVPLDSSELADLVLPYAEGLAAAFNSEVTLLYVCEPEEGKYCRLHEFYLGKISELVKSHIREHRLEKHGTGIKVNSAVLLGRPAEAISDYANKNNIQLIVIASRGRTGIMRRLMGEIADKVFQSTKMPLLLTTTTKPGVELRTEQLLSRILLPLDGSEEGAVALPYVGELIKKLGVEVTLLRVVAPGQHVHTVGGLNYIRFNEQEIASLKANAGRYIEDVGTRLAGRGASIRYETKIGEDPAKEIIDTAKRVNARLIVITTRRQAGIGRRISGSTTQKVLQATNIPVLLLRTRALIA